MWKHRENNSDKIISLHDCRATRMIVESDSLFLEYEDGFWCLPTNKNNSSDNAFRTDLSQIEISKFEIQNIYLFNEKRLFGRLISTKRIDISLEMLTQKINSGQWQLEFLYEYHGFNEVLYHCWIWMNKKPYHKECQITIMYNDIKYLWNNICEDKPW